MVKNDLREQGFSIKDKLTKKPIIIILWGAFTGLMMGGAIAYPIVKGVITHSPVTPVMNPQVYRCTFSRLYFLYTYISH